MAIYVSRKNRIEQKPCQSVSDVFLAFITSRVWIDLKLYKAMDDLTTFEMIWCNKGALCSISEGDLFFSL